MKRRLILIMFGILVLSLSGCERPAIRDSSAPTMFTSAQTEAAGQFSVKVVSVTDGDTISVMQGGKALKIRLARIDAPELHQPYGDKAKRYVSELCFGRGVTVKTAGLDHYGRTLGEIILQDGRNLNEELVRQGLAWWYRQDAKHDRTLERLEAEAQEAKRGLWADPAPVPPWEFRKEARANATP